MKKKKFITLVAVSIITVISFVVIKVKATPANPAFDDLNFYKCVVDAYNGNNDDVSYATSLTDSQLQKIKSINCQSKDIESVKGLEKLTSLTSLNLNSNNLSTIDLSDLTNLNDLELGSNNLREIDLSYTSNLTNLDLWSNNLSTIDLSGLTNLTNLNLNSNNLSTIDLSHTSNLTNLYLWSNNLSTIDLSGLTNLTNLNLNYNNLSTIDLSGLTNLNDLELGSNNLREIDLSHTSNLTNLNLGDNNLSVIELSGLTNLTNLNLVNNNLSTIDLSHTPSLTDLMLDDNRLSTIDLSGLTNLTRLQVTKNKLMSVSINSSNKLNSSHTNFSSQQRNVSAQKENDEFYVDLKENDKNIDISKVVYENQDGITYDKEKGRFKFTKIPKNDITYKYQTGIENRYMDVTLSPSIIGNDSFDDVQLYKCVVDEYNKTHDDISYDVSLTNQQLQQIESLSCMNKDIESAKGLEKLTNLKSLRLGFTSVSSNPKSIKKISLSNINLSYNIKLRTLEIQNTSISTIDLSNLTSLTELDLYNNNLSTIDLSDLTNLTNLDLDSNNLSTIDLSHTLNLTNLNLSGNNLSAIDLSHTPNLKYLYLGGNNLRTIYLSGLTKLTNLNLVNNNLSTIDLSGLTKLTNLNLVNNNLSTIDLSHTPNLAYLYLGGNNLSEIDLSITSNLISLDLEYNNLRAIDLINTPNLTNLKLSFNNLSTIDLSHTPQLNNLELNYNKLSTIDLSHTPQLNNLELNHNKLSTINLSHTPNLTTLYLNNNELMSVSINSNDQLNSSNANFGSQKRNVSIHKTSDGFYVDLKENDKNIDLSKVMYEDKDGITYDKKTGRFTFTKIPKSDITYKYKTGIENKEMTVTLVLEYWKKITYNASYNGGTTSATETTAELGNKADISASATKEGWDFVGWNTDKDAHEALKEGPEVSNDITLYAIFKKDEKAKFYYNSENNKATKEVSCSRYNKEEICNYNLPSEVSTSSGPNNTTYKGVSNNPRSTLLTEEYNSSTSEYYAVYTIDLKPNFYYYDSTTQKQAIDTSSTGTRKAYLVHDTDSIYTVEESSVVIPDVVLTSSGPNGTSYLGISKQVSSTNKADVFTTETTNYYSYYGGSYKVTYQKDEDSVEEISKQEDNCSFTSTTDGSNYTTNSCNITLPTIGLKAGYENSGWYEETKKIGLSGEQYTVTKNVTLTAKGTKIKEDETQPGGDIKDPNQGGENPNPGESTTPGDNEPGKSEVKPGEQTDQNPNEGEVKPGVNNQNANNKNNNIGTQVVDVADTLMNNKVIILVVALILIIIGGMVIYLQVIKNKKI